MRYAVDRYKLSKANNVERMTLLASTHLHFQVRNIVIILMSYELIHFFS